ncbi:uncharacterized protein TrAFT101_009262 [Trichoderma asperellum]|uniref:uncharacterized protein n=1 Tax=Trichoderma asperellum TaxID=101201 RepID=UPI003320D537|nr:hypothetical protein TrAFT101_009262 [Trichoderma asperellum]
MSGCEMGYNTELKQNPSPILSHTQGFGSIGDPDADTQLDDTLQKLLETLRQVSEAISSRKNALTAVQTREDAAKFAQAFVGWHFLTIHAHQA